MVKPAAPTEPNRGHNACVHAVLCGLKLADTGITTELRGLKKKRSPSQLILSTPLLSQDAARLWTCVWHPPTQQQPEEMQRKQLLMAKPWKRDEKFQSFELKASSIVPWFGQQTAYFTQQSPEPYNAQRTLLRPATVIKCRQKPSSTDGSTKSKYPSSDEEQP